MVLGTPWRPSPDDNGASDEGVMPEIIVRMEDQEAMKIHRPEIKEDEYVPRRVYLRSKEFEMHGFTPGCSGCTAMMKGDRRSIHHSEECRARLQMEMGKTEAGKRRIEEAERRGDKYFERLGEKITEIEAEAKRARVERRRADEGRGDPEQGAAMHSPIEIRAPGGHASASSSAAPPVSQERVYMDWDELAQSVKQRAADRFTSEPAEKRMAATRPDEMEEDLVAICEVAIEENLWDAHEVNELDVSIEEDMWEEIWEHTTKGGLDAALDPKLVARAREEEIRYMMRIRVWDESTWEECYRQTGKGPISARWVDVDKARDEVIDVRSRLCARDFKVRGDGREFDVFASMPPLEAKRLLFRMAVADGAISKQPKKGKAKLMFIDAKKAHLSGHLKEDEYVRAQLPPEAGGGVARLRRWLYGVCPTAQA